MTVLGAVVCVLALMGVVLRRPRVTAVALGVAAGLPSSAGIIAAQPIPVFVCVGAVAAVGLLSLTWTVRVERWAWLFAAFVLWSLAITALGPWVFAGTPVLTPRGGIERQLSALTPLDYTSTNLAQALILVTASSAVAFLVRSGTARTALVTAAVTGVGLSLVRSVARAAGADFLAPFLDTLQTYYATTDLRWRGVFNEPSELAAFALGVAAMSGVAMCTATRTRARVLHLALASGALVLMVGSASGTAVLAAGIVGAVAVVVVVVRWLRSGGVGTEWLVVTGLLVGVALVLQGGAAVGFVTAIIEGKVGSGSQIARSGADAVALQVIADSWGVGVGLGGNRSSSFFLTLLSTVGIVGSALFVSMIAVVTREALRHRAGVSAVAGLLAVLVAKTVATPDLGTPLMWLLLAAAVTILPATSAAPHERSARVPDRHTTFH